MSGNTQIPQIQHVEHANTSQTRRRLKARTPILYAITVLPDYECLINLQAHGIITSEEVWPGSQWEKVDDAGNNMLHLCGIHKKPLSLRFVMGELNEDVDSHLAGLSLLLKAKNGKEQTPFQTFRASLITERDEWIESLGKSDHNKEDSVEFPGFEQKSLDCLQLFRKLCKTEYGCFCRKCIDGFISPRMKFLLLQKAEQLCQTRKEDNENGAERQTENWNKILSHFDLQKRNVLENNKKVRKDFYEILNLIMQALREELAPYDLHVLLQAKKGHHMSLKSYREMGCTIEDARRVCFAFTREAIEDGSHEKELEKEIANLPACANDYEFEKVELLLRDQ